MIRRAHFYKELKRERKDYGPCAHDSLFNLYKESDEDGKIDAAVGRSYIDLRQSKKFVELVLRPCPREKEEPYLWNRRIYHEFNLIDVWGISLRKKILSS